MLEEKLFEPRNLTTLVVSYSESWYRAVNTKTATSYGSGATSGCTGLTIGCYVGGGAYSNSTIAEVAAFNRVLTAGEKTNLMTYAGARYNISIGA
jgi:hypothetical protein